MTRIALLPSEAIRPRMAGIGIRYLELARRLPRPGIEVVLVTPGDPAEVPGDLPAEVRRFERGRLPGDPRRLRRRGLPGPAGQRPVDRVSRAAGGDRPLRPLPGREPALHRDPGSRSLPQRSRDLGAAARRGATSSSAPRDEQRQFYLGFLAALGRLNPERVGARPRPRRADRHRALRGARGAAAAPSRCLPRAAAGREAPALRRPLRLVRPLAGPRGPGGARRARLDPARRSATRTRRRRPSACSREVEAWCRARGWWGERVRALDWVPSDRRYDLLRDVDLLVATHRPSLETRLSLRTRFLDALAAGCPVVTTEGGAMSRLLDRARRRLGGAAGLAGALAAAFREIAGGSRSRADRGTAPGGGGAPRALLLGAGAGAPGALLRPAAQPIRPRRSSPSGRRPWRRRTVSRSASRALRCGRFGAR